MQTCWVDIEIEIELMNDFVEKDKLTFDQIANYLRRVIKIVLSGLQQTNYPIGYEEQDEVLMEYMDHLLLDFQFQQQRHLQQYLQLIQMMFMDLESIL